MFGHKKVPENVLASSRAALGLKDKEALAYKVYYTKAEWKQKKKELISAYGYNEDGVSTYDSRKR